MNLFVVGDVHGCLNTFKEMLEHWQPKEEILIQVGDLISKGNLGPQTIVFVKELKEKYGNQVVLLKGNHEYNFIEYFKGNINEKWYNKSGGKNLLWQYQLEEKDASADAEWINTWPVFWENEKLFISHAGRSLSENYLNLGHTESLLFNKGKIKKLEKMQIYGHRPVNKEASYDNETNSWNIDTGAVYGGKLSAMKLKPDGELLNFYKVQVKKSDIE
jgi:serine/threonine protein phosphatase 1